MTIAIDFDGTIVEHKYPKIGEERPFATDTLKMLIADHHRLILWTVREGELLGSGLSTATTLRSTVYTATTISLAN